MITATDMMRMWYQAWFPPIGKAWFAPASEAWFEPIGKAWLPPIGKAWLPFGGEAFLPAPFKRPAETKAPAKRSETAEEVRRVRPVTVSIAGNHAAVALLPMRRTTH